MKWWKKIYQFNEPFHKSWLVLIGFIVLGQALALVWPLVGGLIIDGLVAKKPIVDLMIVIIVSLLLNWLRSYLKNQEMAYAESHLVNQIVRYFNNLTNQKFISWSIGQHRGKHSGIKQQVASRGVSALIGFSNNIIYGILPQVIMIFLSLVAIGYYSIWIALLMVVFGIGYCVILVKMNQKHYPLLQENEKAWKSYDKSNSELMRNVSLILAHSQEDRMVREVDDGFNVVSAQDTKIWLSYLKSGAKTFYYLDVVGVLVIIIGLWLVSLEQLSAGKLISIIWWSGSVLGNLGSMRHLHRQYLFQKNKINEFFEMIEIEPDIKVVTNSIELTKIESMKFVNVDFAYPVRGSQVEVTGELDGDGSPGKLVLKNLNLTINQGEKIALVGESGAGKSTIPFLLMRASDPQQGEVLINDKDLRLLNLKKYRSLIGVVDQSTVLFDRSLRDNILFALNGSAKDYPQEKLWELLEAVRLKEFVESLPEGLDTLVGENGVKLSGGQQQRVAIARALAKDPSVLIFDEATSSLDAVNEKQIQEAIDRASVGRTTIIIAHRLSTIKNVDRIVLVQDGEIVSIGNYKELMGSCPKFQTLVAAQA